MATSISFQGLSRGLVAAAATASIVAVSAGCDVPFGLDQPTTRSLEAGAASALSTSPSFEITGTYVAGGVTWALDLQLARPATVHVMLTGGSMPLEAIVTGGAAYFRGREFLRSHLATDARSQQLAAAAGDSWWKGLPGAVPAMTDFTDGTAFRSTFLGSAADRRIDHVAVDGIPAVELSGPRADVYIASASPERPLRLRLHDGVVLDGIQSADFRYGHFGTLARILPPANVVDFANLATLPPLYTAVSVDTSRCGSPCVVTALLQNQGGTQQAVAPSYVTFNLVDALTGRPLGSCQVKVIPDVPYATTTRVGCTIPTETGVDLNADTVTAVPTNPGRG